MKENENEVEGMIKGFAKLNKSYRGADLRACFIFYLFFGLKADYCLLGALYRGCFECYPKAISTGIQR